jgi:hypothetical protein
MLELLAFSVLVGLLLDSQFGIPALFIKEEEDERIADSGDAS